MVIVSGHSVSLYRSLVCPGGDLSDVWPETGALELEGSAVNRRALYIHLCEGNCTKIYQNTNQYDHDTREQCM